jgi:exodeoxyribonuclease VII large subunit
MRAGDPAAPDVVVSVSRLANYLTRKFAADSKLRRLGVSGEISGLSLQPNGTMYFDLKDRDALIRCVAWSEAAASFPPLANGQAVIATGSVGVYGKRSTYQLTVFALELEGAGRLHALYEALKRRLETEGLFAQSRKRALPAFPFRVALVSSKAANGAGDFLAQAAALAPHVTIVLFETPVQGENAAPEIVRALDRASRASVDLVVLARGGGSYEDLFVFNDERVVRALARCAHPTVSAIGHEADAPLTDFVADRRAATPSTAAQTILPRRVDLLDGIRSAVERLERAASRGLAGFRRELARIEVRSPLAGPRRLLALRRQAVDMARVDLRRAAEARLRAHSRRLAAASGRLEACNPGVRLSRRRERLANLQAALQRTIAARLRINLEAFATAKAGLQSANPSLRLSGSRQRLALADLTLRNAARHARGREGRRLAAALKTFRAAAASALRERRTRLQLAVAVLDGRDPTQILQRGYAIVTLDGKVLRDAAAAAPGARISAQLARGTLAARVEPVGSDGGE